MESTRRKIGNLEKLKAEMDFSPEIDAELDELVRVSEQAAATLRSPWEPPCIARTFTSKQTRTFTLTMQGWIDLSAIRSPLLQDERPANAAEFYAALGAFDAEEKEGCQLTPEQAAVMADEMLAAVREAFSMALRMHQPNSTPDEEPDGFGDWLIVWSALIVQCGCSRVEALNFPVGQAFALIAAMRRNQGWEVAGEPYALREMENQGEKMGNQEKLKAEIGEAASL